MSTYKKFYGKSNKDDVAHAWAHNHYDSSDNYNGSMFHRGDSIYSYGNHFEMARKVEIDGETVVFWNPSTYSNTTSTHQSAVQSAIPYSWKQLDLIVFPSQNKAYWKRDNDAHIKNIRHHLDRAKDFTEKQKRARKRDYTDEIDTALHQAREIYRIFKPTKLTKIEREILTDFNHSTEGEELEMVKKAQTRQRKAEQKRKADKYRKKKEQELERWRAGERNAYVGDAFGYLLRVRDGNIETSTNMRVSIEDAKPLWKLVNKVKQGSENWKKNGKTFEIGHYSVDLIQAGTGDIIIGCHDIKYDEMYNVAKELGWV